MVFQRSSLQVILIALILFSKCTIAEETKRSGFSYLGVGLTQIDYEESTSPGGLSIRSDVSGSKFTQRSGAYVSVSKKWGFYLISSSFFGSDSFDERWKIDGIPVQENKVTLKRSEVQLLITREVFHGGRHYLMFGGSNTETSFTRFDFSYPEQNQHEVSNEQRNITEDISKFIAFFGYEYNDFYFENSPGIRYQLQVLLGIPLYSEILNNSESDTTFDTNFDGYSFRLNPSVGWQFDKHFLISFSAGFHYSYREEEKKSYGGGTLVLPEHDYLRIFPALSMYWSF